MLWKAKRNSPLPVCPLDPHWPAPSMHASYLPLLLNPFLWNGGDCRAANIHLSYLCRRRHAGTAAAPSWLPSKRAMLTQTATSLVGAVWEATSPWQWCLFGTCEWEGGREGWEKCTWVFPPSPSATHTRAVVAANTCLSWETPRHLGLSCCSGALAGRGDPLWCHFSWDGGSCDIWILLCGRGGGLWHMHPLSYQPDCIKHDSHKKHITNLKTAAYILKKQRQVQMKPKSIGRIENHHLNDLILKKMPLITLGMDLYPQWPKTGFETRSVMFVAFLVCASYCGTACSGLKVWEF